MGSLKRAYEIFGQAGTRTGVVIGYNYSTGIMWAAAFCHPHHLLKNEENSYNCQICGREIVTGTDYNTRLFLKKSIDHRGNTIGERTTKIWAARWLDLNPSEIEVTITEPVHPF